LPSDKLRKKRGFKCRVVFCLTAGIAVLAIFFGLPAVF